MSFPRIALHALGILTVLGLVVAITSCNDSGDSTDTPVAPAVTTRAYNGTASVGDMVTISVNATDRVITYHNFTAGLSGTASYIVESDGSWSITDAAHGHLLKGYELPNFALVLQVDHAGPGADQKAIVTAIESQDIAVSDLVGSGKRNYMQFRTNNGGMELGWLDGDAGGNLIHQHYWPYGATNSPPEPYSATSAFPASAFTASADHQYLTVNDDPGNPPSYVFRSTGGFLAVDTSNGSLVCLRQSSTSAFLDGDAGTYKAFTYQKQNAVMDYSGGGNGVELGAPTLETRRVVFSRSTDVAHPERGHITAYNTDGSVGVDTDLMTLTDGGYVGAGKLEDACNGLFTFTKVDGTRTTQVFVSFLTDAALIAAFTTDSASMTPNSYSYFYGTALRVNAGGG